MWRGMQGWTGWCRGGGACAAAAPAPRRRLRPAPPSLTPLTRLQLAALGVCRLGQDPQRLHRYLMLQTEARGGLFRMHQGGPPSGQAKQAQVPQLRPRVRSRTHM